MSILFHNQFSSSFQFLIRRRRFSSINLSFSIAASVDVQISSNLQSLSSTQNEQISRYTKTLLHWNQKMNLTAVTEESEVMKRHVEDSLALIGPIRKSYRTKNKPDDDAISLVDVGSGAGLPGLIFAIACPNWKVTLLESLQKRCIFLEHVVDLIGLSNVKILRERAENAGQSPNFRESYDVAVARAVAEMRILAEYCLPLVRVGGLFVAAKGYDPQEEVRKAETAIKMMGASVLELCSVESEGPLGRRTAVICLKNQATPKKYPRHPGLLLAGYRFHPNTTALASLVERKKIKSFGGGFSLE